jgi:hypothetical protein
LIFFVITACVEPTPFVQSTDTSVPTFTKTPTFKPTQITEITSTLFPTQLSTPTERSELPDLTGEIINFYHLGDSSSEYAEVLSLPLIRGIQVGMDQINKRGGIFGAQIELHYEDTEGDLMNALEAYERFIEEDANLLLLFTYSPSVEEALYKRISGDKIPVISSGLSSQALYGVEEGYLFSLMAPYPDQFGYFLDYLVSNWEQIRPMGAGDEIKLSVLSWSSQIEMDFLTGEMRAYAEKLGVQIVSVERIDLNPVADTVTAILNAQVSGANVIYTNLSSFGLANIINDLNNLGLRDDFLLGGSIYSLDLSVCPFLGNLDYLNDFIAPYTFPHWSGCVFDLDTISSSSSDRMGMRLGFLLSLAAADLVQYIVEKVILNVGFENLSREQIYNELIQIDNYISSINDLDLSISFTEGKRSPGEFQLLMIQGTDSYRVLQNFTSSPFLLPTP